MAGTSSELLTRYDELGIAGQIVTAFDLSRAAKSFEGLHDELPLPALGYASPINALKRVRRIAKNGPARGVYPHAVQINGSSEGVATYQLYEASDEAAVSAFRDEPSSEVAYWLSRKYQCDVLAHGVVLDALIKKVQVVQLGELWAISHPDDAFKSSIYKSVGFSALNDVEYVDLGHEELVPRTVWQYER